MPLTAFRLEIATANQPKGAVKMTIINLRDYFPEYGLDCFVEVPDMDFTNQPGSDELQKFADAYINALTPEVVQIFFEEELREMALQRKTYRHKAHYSLDRDDGIENEAVDVQADPFEEILFEMEAKQLYAALSTLPEKQAKRIYAHYILGISKTEIAMQEGVSKVSVFNSISHGMKNLKKYFGI